MNEHITIGVVGYSAQKFDKTLAEKYISEAFDKIQKANPKCYKFVVVSGLTDLGIPALAYREATKRKWKTVGIACSKAKEYDCYPVTYEKIVGDNWGDESDTFLKTFDVLVKIGGGKQSIEEAKKAKEQGKEIIEYKLEASK